MQPPLHTDLENVAQEDAFRLIKAPKAVEGRTEEVEEPPSKKLKSSENGFPSKPWKLRAVLGDAAISPVPLVPALAAQILDKKETSKLIRRLNEVLPIPCLQHLKRVKSLKEGETTYIYLLLWRLDSATCDIDSNIVIKKLKEAGVDVNSFSCHFRHEMVAKFAPLTRSQFEGLKAQPSYWPCNFHEDKYFESLVTSSHELWAEENRVLQEMFMTKARARSARGGGVVVDPSTNVIVAMGHGTEGHPLHHTVINLVDLVARSQGGGALAHTEQLETLEYNTEILKSNKANGNVQEPEDKPTTSHNHLKRYGSIAQLSTVPKTGPYLCTGYDVYLSHEPCHLCSMALIHMRTRRVFYSAPTRDGALGSCDKIHTLEGLNHRYEVYTGILQPEENDVTDCC